MKDENIKILLKIYFQSKTKKAKYASPPARAEASTN